MTRIPAASRTPVLSLVVALCALGVSATAARAQVGASVTIIDANVATEAELSALSQLTPALVASIVDARPFQSITEFDAVLAGTLDRPDITALYGRIFVHVNLNTATRDEILLIPNAGPRMAHEFEEYRPYPALAQFHREIAKYVDDTELARLAQYVFVPIDLNTASDADILTIPGLGARMLHEFKEYRPYAAIAQFRREMGKYVDVDEVARMERFVTIK
jgi:DNA uptake protein ComE-like DNA-binding protein